VVKEATGLQMRVPSAALPTAQSGAD